MTTGSVGGHDFYLQYAGFIPLELEVGGRMLLFQFLNFLYISRKIPKRGNLAFEEQSLKTKRSFYRIYHKKYGFEDYCWVISRC